MPAPTDFIINNETDTPKKSDKAIRWREIAIVALSVLLLISVILLALNKFAYTGQPQLVIPEADGEVFDGMLPYNNPDEVLRLLQEKVDKNQFAFRINANPVFAADCKRGNLRVENPVRNIYDMQTELILDETGEILYSSPLIRPNQYVEHVGLTRKLEIGSHAATARFIAIHPDTGAYVGEVAASISVSVCK